MRVGAWVRDQNSTFLFTLCGKATYGEMQGSLKINGKDATVADYRAAFGFVPRESVLCPVCRAVAPFVRRC
eukprot:COSAG01_NODE_3852_length_5629_cov_3.080108_4_plen_71_part_00